MQYSDFLASKRITSLAAGFDVEYSDLHSSLFDFQAYVVKWALKKGRAAIWADTGTGKTIQQLCWAKHVYERTGQNVLILAPLGVAKQTVREGARWGIEVRYAHDQSDVEAGITITNYERLEKFDRSTFGALVLDESSILKSFSGVTRKFINDFAEGMPYRLACTATPAPNDLIELINHAEFLGIMSGKEMIALYFTQDGNTTHAWRLKGHAKKDFWKWLSGWAIALRKPSDLGFTDEGYILPPLRTHQITMEAVVPDGSLFAIEAQSLQDRQKARKASQPERVAACAELVNGSDEPWMIWCNLNSESEALTKAIPGAVEVKGADSQDHKERSILDFTEGRIRVLVSKPSIFGFGINMQHCSKVAFVGLSDSWEQYYQAVRRCWRFGQKNAVDCYVITSEAEGAVIKNIERKEAQANELFAQLINEMKGHTMESNERQEMEYKTDVAKGKDWTLYLGDCVEMMDRIETESVGLSVFSPPFPCMYAYTNSAHDIGNTNSIETFMEHFRYLAGKEKLLRVTKPGRLCCLHLMQLTAMKSREGYIGLKDYRGRVIAMMEEEGWIYHGEATIDKNPQVQATRNKERGLLFKSLATDSAMMRMALADYLLYFKKPGENTDPIRAGKSNKYNPGGGWITEEEWIEWASPVWQRQSKAHPHGIHEGDVLNVRQARETDDERHLCPLQLGVIERAVKLWSNPGDLVLSPFAGIGSEGYQSLLLNRKFVGIELKESYWRSAIENLRYAESRSNETTIFSLLPQGDESEVAA